jgi:hypothetical protein
MTELLSRAFAALGAGPTQRELELVAQALRDSEDDDTVAALEAAITDREAADTLTELALASGSSGFVALDLKTEFFNPGADGSMLPSAARR